MEILFITIPISLLLVAIFLGLFIWGVRNGQMDSAEENKTILFNINKGRKDEHDKK